MSGNREALKVTSRMLGGGSDPGADVTSRNELTDGPTHRDPPEGISKKLEGRVGFQMAQKQGGVCSDHALLTGQHKWIPPGASERVLKTNGGT